ncbi:putative ribonuclease H-like domain-containing protein [Tanacetum coccineum]
MQVPSSSNGPMLWNAMQSLMQKSIAKLHDKIDAKDGSCTIWDPAGIDSAGGVSAGSTSAGSDPAGGNLAGSLQPAGSYEPTGKGNPAVSTIVLLTFLPYMRGVNTSPGQSLGSVKSTTRRFQSLLMLCKISSHRHLHYLSSYDMIYATLTNLAPACEIESIPKALEDPDLEVAAMQEEMQQFINQKIWTLVPLPDGKNAIGTKWILKNKRDARGIVVRNKARLVAQGHRQEEGIASMMRWAFPSILDGFKSAFLYGEKRKKKCKVTHAKGFEDPYFPKHVYRVWLKLCMDFIKHLEPRSSLRTEEISHTQSSKHSRLCATSSTEADMMLLASCCAQCEEPSLSSEDQHIEIRHHFIMRSHEKEHDTAAEDSHKKIMRLDFTDQGNLMDQDFEYLVSILLLVVHSSSEQAWFSAVSTNDSCWQTYAGGFISAIGLCIPCSLHGFWLLLTLSAGLNTFMLLELFMLFVLLILLLAGFKSGYCWLVFKMDVE